MDYGRERKLCGDSVGCTPASARQSHGSRNPCRARSTAGSISSSSAVGGRGRVLLSGGERYPRCTVRNSDVPCESRSKSVARPTGACGAGLRSVNCRSVKLIRSPPLFEMGRCGLLPTVRMGRQIRVEEARLMSWIESGGRALPGGWKRYPGYRTLCRASASASSGGATKT